MTTTKLSGHEIVEALCRATGKWGLYLSLNATESPKDLMLAVPYLQLLDEDHGFWDHGGGIILSDTEKEMRELFQRTVGDDGPTPLNTYDGPVRVYACACSPSGQLLGCNT